MFKFIALAALAASSVSALVVPRSTPPAGYNTGLLEPYDTYHTRYMALQCNVKHNTAFFDSCCHPLLANESLATRPAQCNPSATPSTAAAASAASPSADPVDDDEDEYCDDGDDEPPSSSSAPIAPAATTPLVPTTTPVNTPEPTTTKPASAATQAPASGVNTGGFATFFYQNGVAGACGTVHSDNDMIAAIDGDRYGNLSAQSPLCGKQVKLTNANNGKSITVTIADACPTCKNSNSIDLSEGAFKQIATLDEGMVPITWSFV